MIKVIATFATLVFLLVVPGVQSRGTETRHCITNAGDLRIFIEHWHYDWTSSGEQIQIRDDTSNITDYTMPTGIINNQLPGDLHKNDCAFGATILGTTCNHTTHNDWIYFDVPATCNTSGSYTLLEPAGILLQPGCDGLYLVTFSSYDSTACQPSVSTSLSDVPSMSRARSVALSLYGVPSTSRAPSASPSESPSVCVNEIGCKTKEKNGFTCDQI